MKYRAYAVIGMLGLALPSAVRCADVVSIWGGARGTVVRKSDGTVWTWGANFAGKLGVGLGSTNLNRQLVPTEVHGTADVGFLNSVNAITVPVKVVGLTNPAAVSAGYKFSIALMPDGTVFQWGHGRVIANTYAPVQVPGLSNITAISAGWDHALALRSDHTVWAWGQNNYGEIGDGGAGNRTNPVQVTSLSNIVAVSGGDWHSSALDSSGMIWKWGRNDVGQLGNGTADSSQHPLPAKILLDNNGNGFSNIVLMAARDYHNIAGKGDGSVWQWGANAQGQCGDNTTVDRWRPVQVTGLGLRVGLPLKIQRNAQPGQYDLSWASATGEFFNVEYTTNLAAGFPALLLTNVLATPPTNSVTVTATNGDCFYRLKF